MNFGVAQPMAHENSAKRAAIVLFLILAPSSALADVRRHDKLALWRHEELTLS
jgi:hypothetical protein